MIRSIRGPLAAALVLFLAALPTAAAAGPGGTGRPALALPPEDCVRLLRAARIAEMKGDPAAALARLREAAESFPDEIAPLNALLEFHRRQPLPEDEHRRLRERLLARLGDPNLVVPPGVLEQMALDPRADEEALRAMAEKVSRQVGDEGEPDARLLAVLARLQERLGEDEAAFATWQRLWRTTGSELAVGPLLRLSARLEHWSVAAQLLKTFIDRGDTGLRWSYISALSRLGRDQEVLAQIDLLLREQVEEPCGPGRGWRAGCR